MFKVLNFCCIYLAYTMTLVEGIKYLKDNPGFDNTAAWESGYLPCALEQVVFPETYAAVLPLPKQVDIGGFILPHDGAILLNQDMTIDLSGETTKNPKISCENGSGRRAYLKQPQIRKWFDPESWISIQTKNRNNKKAKTLDNSALVLTHLESVPCDNEPVIIKPKGPISIDLEYGTYMRMGQLSFAGSLVTKDYMQYLLTTDLGQLMFHHSEAIIVEYYRDGVCGCHRDFVHLTEPVCRNVVSNCDIPHCLEPIIPYGSCCPVCGAVMRNSVDRCDNVKLEAVKTLLENWRIIQNMDQDLQFDISYFDSKEYGKFLQIIVIDRLEYKERSVAFLQQFTTANHNLTSILGGTNGLKMIYAGHPYNPSVSLLSILLIILCLMFVLFVALVISAHYEPHHYILQHVPIWSYDIQYWRALLTRTQRFAFARFENATNVVNVGSSRQETLDTDVQETPVDNVGENIAIGYNAKSGRIRERSFDNPMFNKKPNEKYKTKIEEKEEAHQQQTQPILETGSLTIAQTEGVEEIQELKEIKLESTSDDDDSDIEAETQE